MLGLLPATAGHGCKVSTSLLANGAWPTRHAQAQLAGATFFRKATTRSGLNFIALHYKTGDGRILRLCLLNSERDWPKFCAAIARDE